MKLTLPLLLFILTRSTPSQAQAEPAPPDYVPPKRAVATPPPIPLEEPPSTNLRPDQPKWSIAVAPRLLIRPGSAGDLSRVGYGGGVRLSRALVRLGRARLGVGLGFAYDKLEGTERVIGPNGSVSQSSVTLAAASFTALAVLDGIFGRVRPWGAVGAGFLLGTFANDILPLGHAQLALGLGVRVFEQFEIGLHGEANLTFPSASAGMPPHDPISPGLLAVVLDLGFLF